jgi:hypothetical protein
MSFSEYIINKSKYERNLQQQQQRAQPPRRTVGKYSVLSLGCSGGGLAGLDLERLCSSASMSADIIEPLGGYRRRTVDVVESQQFGNLSTRARRDMTARSSKHAGSSDDATTRSNAGPSTGFDAPCSQPSRSSSEAASAAAAPGISTAAVAEAAAIVAAFAAPLAAAAAEGEQLASALEHAVAACEPEVPAGMQAGGEPTESTAADKAAAGSNA